MYTQKYTTTRTTNDNNISKNNFEKNFISQNIDEKPVVLDFPKQNNRNNDLISNLVEFGLSQYEARAYLTMIGRGSLSASEIAYYSNLPRTKIYLTLKKLEKKGLSIISQQKPLICSAINPKEAFNEILSIQEQRLKNMKMVIDTLHKINEQASYIKSSEEKRYYILDPKSTKDKIIKLIENSRSTIIGMLDLWGFTLLSQCTSSLIKAISKNIKIQLLLSTNCRSNNLSSLPSDIEIKIGEVFSNIIIIDSNTLINIDSNNGKAALFPSLDNFGFSYVKTFERAWNM
ncbi:MAG: TrmB family transcriptional regulator [Nitrososphaeraceae archaeon]